MMRLSRRKFLDTTARAAAIGTALGCSPAGMAMAQGSPDTKLRIFSNAQAKTYAAWCNILAIGAAEAGVALFVDKYLADAYPASLLLTRYLQNPPFAPFYLTGIAGIDQESRKRFSKPFLDLVEADQNSIVHAAATSATVAWTDPNPNFFYFISRSDAVDVVYGTVEGFGNLDVPYLEHIRPDHPW